MAKDVEPETITIEGENGRVRDYKAIKEAVVCIANKYYRRDDDARIVLVKNPQGKLRFFRRDSPLICKDVESNEMVLKSECYQTEDGVFLNKKSPNVVEIKGKFYRRAYCYQIDNQWFLKTDPTIIKCDATGNTFIKGTGITLSKKYYPKWGEIYPKTKTKTLSDGEIVLVDDVQEYFCSQDAVIKTMHRQTAGGIRWANVFYDFQDKTNPQEERLVFKSTPEADWITGQTDGTYINVSISPNTGTVWVHKALREYLQDCIDRYITPRYMTKCNEARESINANYSDLDKTENTAKTFYIVPKPFAGKYSIYQPGSFGQPVMSRTFVRTGGLQYSFGVELETSQGLIKDTKLMEELQIFCVGDRSVGSAEYVTSPMMGDNGMEMLKKIAEALNKATLVDDRCGVHVHVGTLWKPKEKGEVPKAKQAPSFNDQFIMNSINLGAAIEEELYSSLPPNRQPCLYHCHSIKRFAPITAKNFETVLGAYIFGPKEWWKKPNDQCREQLFDFQHYKLGPVRNKNSKLGTWAEGRYKWLNLIPSYTKAAHRTIEFRIFNGTTNYTKLRAFVLTSMAFTYVADNVPKLCVPGTTLSQVFEAAFSKAPSTLAFLNEFYEERKARFNRKQIYPKLDLPFLK